MNRSFIPTTTQAWFKRIAAAALAVACVWSPIAPAAPAAAAEVGESKPAITLDSASAVKFMDDFFASEAAKPYYVGASVVIVKDGEVIASKGYGYADSAKPTPVDPEKTTFRIASVSKTFTAAAIMQLAEQGKLDLKGDIRQYLNGLSYENPYDKPVTIEHLLTHTSGFEVRDPRPEDIHQDFSKYVAIEDYVRAHMPSVVREPGTAYLYDNFAYLLLGLIVQNVSGEPYEDYMEKHLFEPLGMDDSGFLLEGKLKEQLAVGYTAANQPIEPYAVTPTIMPHGGMISTAEDVGKFMLAFLNGGAAGTERILSEQSVKMMEEYRSAIHPLLPDTTYGFEAPMQLPEAGSSSKIIGKAGDLNGFSSYLFMIPEQNTGVFLTYNKMGALRNLFYPQFISTFFPQYAEPVEFDDWTEPAGETLEKFGGLYSDLRIGMFVSSLNADEAGTLTISDAFLGPRTLKQVDDNLFMDSIANQLTAFKLDESGQVAYMKEPYINPLGYARKGETPAGFSDVDENYAYAEPIYSLQSLGYYPNDAGEAFQPEREVTRAEFVKSLLEISNLKGSPSTDYAFSDIEGHDAAPFIQQAYELGMVTGTGGGKFEPDRTITRQEYAMMIWGILKNQYPPELYSDVRLTGDTSEWAVPAVQMTIAFGYHGPEVQELPDGSYDFGSTKPLTRQEEAAVYYTMLTRYVDQIAAANQAGLSQ